jgi:hypothetical protein
MVTSKPSLLVVLWVRDFLLVQLALISCAAAAVSAWSVTFYQCSEVIVRQVASTYLFVNILNVSPILICSCAAGAFGLGAVCGFIAFFFRDSSAKRSPRLAVTSALLAAIGLVLLSLAVAQMDPRCRLRADIR